MGITTIKLLELELRNFQKSTTTIQFNGEDYEVRGTNGAGKTTLANAWFWLFTGKDSENKATLDIKTLKSDGQPVHNLEHSVRAVLDVNGKKREFQKLYQEVWQAERGNKLKKTLTKHECLYWVDGVPKSAGEFDAAVLEICQPELIRTLGDPMFFGGQLKWEVRRQEFVKLAGDISIDDVIASFDDDQGEDGPFMADLPEILGGLSPKDKEVVLMAELKRLRPEADEIQPRIDELMRQVDTTLVAKPTLEIESKIDDLRKQKVMALAGSDVAELNLKIQKLRTDRQAKVNELTSGQGNAYSERLGAVQALNQQLVAAGEAAAKLLTNKKLCEDGIVQKTLELETLMAQDVEAQEMEFQEPEPGMCAGCGRPLPEDQVQATRDKLFKEFNDKKAKLLESLLKRGEAAAHDKQVAEANLKAVVDQLVGANKMVEELTVQHNQAKVALSMAVQPRTNWDDHQDVLAFDALITQTEGELQKIRDGQSETAAKFDDQITTLQTELKAIQDANASVEASSKATSRIEELQQKHLELQSRIETNQRIVWLIERFYRAKAKLLSDRINQYFTFCQVKLFEDQLNGGSREICEIMVEGVPWGSANRGSRVNAGLEIINAFTQLYQCAPPIWLDNAESIAQFIPSIGQQIRLIMDPSKPKLTW